jgi:hypothetical protein
VPVGANWDSGGLLTGRPGRLAAVAAAAALVPAVTVAGAGVRARAAVREGRAAAAGVMSTVAGRSAARPRPGRGLFSACGVAFSGGNVYIGDGTAVRRVSPGSDWLTTPAGIGTAGPFGNEGLAVRAALSNACGVAVDHAGNLVIADTNHSRIRVVAASSGTFYGQAMTARDIYTVAGGWHRRVLRRRRPGYQRRTIWPGRGGDRCLRQPGDRRQRQQPDPNGGGLIPGQAPGTPAGWQRVAITPPPRTRKCVNPSAHAPNR